MFNLSSIQEVLTAVQSLATIIALIIGGGWALYQFRLFRQRSLKAKVSQKIYSETIEQDNKTYTLLKLCIYLENIGTVKLQPDYGFIRIQEVDPLPDSAVNDLFAGEGAVKQGDPSYGWPLIVEHDQILTGDNERLIEPGETDEIHADFIINPTTSKVLLHCFIGNVSRDNKIGWSSKTLYNITSNEVLI